MQFTREIQRIVIMALIALGLVALTSTYWVLTGERVLNRDDNPRLVEATARIMRGGIYDRDGVLLVETNPSPTSGRAIRTYHHPAMHSVLGYYSMRYGEGGAEAAFNERLQGEREPSNLWRWFERYVMHQPQTGDDIRLTLDLAIQQAAHDALDGRRGALVVVSVPDGAIKALVSLPTFDPNELDARWGELTQDAGEPFFNRALQGAYQPGATMYSLLVLSALVNQFPAEIAFDSATRPIEVGDVRLTCTEQPPADILTIFDALTFGCPAPFADFAEQIGYDAIHNTLRLIRPDLPPTLSGFITESASPERVPSVIGLKEALGQGDFRTTPLEMALVMASFINNGNAPAPVTLQAARPAYSDDWVTLRTVQPSLPITTPENARRIAALLRQNVVRGTAQEAFHADFDIGGQSALSYAGAGVHTWFVGFLREEARRGYAIALILEDTQDLALAATIGGEVLRAAATARAD
ncbi:MAG: hypothetical protein EA396_04805 [Anaerolineaceae bacterium]|nr:MAG: hypothetical protein EA396_04805 [Anaerolineaceae bacterium]